MKEIHGLRVKKATAGGDEDGQEVEVEDYGAAILLRLGTSAFPAVLTPDEGRFLAKALNAAADRIDPRPIHDNAGRQAGGLARAAILGPAQRSEIASQAEGRPMGKAEGDPDG